MFAVVQTGSKTRRSPCSTARTVRETGGVVWALRRAGAAVSAPAARLPWTNLRRVVVMSLSLQEMLNDREHSLRLATLGDQITVKSPSTWPGSDDDAAGRQRVVGPERPGDLAIGVFAHVEMRGAAAVGVDHRTGDRPIGGMEMV